MARVLVMAMAMMAMVMMSRATDYQTAQSNATSVPYQVASHAGRQRYGTDDAVSES